MRSPNILLLFTDQQRHDTIAALGNPLIRTPALDRLVREGTAFERCYTPAPVCVAARCALMTGLPPRVTGCCDNEAMPQTTPSVVERLRAAGYQTHGVGKMHFTPDHTRLWGFETRDIAEEGKFEHDDFCDFVRTHGYEHVDDFNGVRSEYYYVPQPSQLPARLHPTQWTGDRAIDFLKRRDPARPFFLMTSFLRPHPPFESPTPWNQLYRAADMPPPHVPAAAADFRTYWNALQNRFKYRGAWGTDTMLLRTIRAAYYGCISFVDFQIGRILDELGDDAENTVVVFTSDHGELLGDYGCVGKRTMQEASARVPLIARWPGALRANTRSCTPVSLLDVHATFLDAAGLGAAPHAEGASLRHLARRRKPRVVFSQFQKRDFAQYLATDGHWKYTYSTPDRRETLVNLDLDPAETRNLSRSRSPAARAALRALRAALQSQHRRDRYADGFTAHGWKKYPRPALPQNPDESLIFQDAPSTEVRLQALPPDYRPTIARHSQGVAVLEQIVAQSAPP